MTRSQEKDSASDEADTIAVARPKRNLQPSRGDHTRQPASHKRNLPRQARLQSKSKEPVEVEHDTESDGGEAAALQPSRKRKSRAQVEDASHVLEEDEEDEEMVPKKKSRPAKKQALETSPKPQPHIILAKEVDCNFLFYLMQWPNASLRARVLEVHLDATKQDDYAEDRLTLALNRLHPLSDGANPHDLQLIRLVVKGNLLFTRYSYHLASPALSDDVNEDLTKLITGNLTEEEKARLPYKITSTEKGVANALLGIRGVKQVTIDGRGKMEGDFAETLKATLVQPPGTGVIESEDPTLPNSTHEVNGVGEIESEGYELEAERPYPTRTYKFKHDFSSLADKDRYLVDEKVQLLGHFLDLPEEEAKVAAITQSSVPRSRKTIREFEVDTVTKTRVSKHGTNAKKRKREQGGGLGLVDMVRIRARKQDVEDGGMSKTWSEAKEVNLPLILTGKGGTVELGWKV